MKAALRAELRKIVTTRAWWVLALVMAGYMAFIAAVMAWSFVFSAQHPDSATMGSTASLALDPRDQATSVYTLALSLGYVFPALFGAMAVTGEFRHQTITPTFLAEPRRGVVLGAKLLAIVPFGVLLALAGTLATVGAGGATLAIMGEPSFLGDGQVLGIVVRSALALTLWALVGVGFGAVLSNQIAAIVALLVFTQFLEPILRIGLGAWGPTRGLSKFLPGAAGEAIAGTSLYSSSGLAHLLGAWQGALVLVVYALALALVGRFTTFRRDVA